MKDLYKRIDEKYENMSGLFGLVPSTKHQVTKHQAPSKLWQMDKLSSTKCKNYDMKDLYKRRRENKEVFSTFIHIVTSIHHHCIKKKTCQ